MPISEIDFTLSQTLGMSYKSLPKDYPLPACSGRTSLCEGVLNDEWVSVPRSAPSLPPLCLSVCLALSLASRTDPAARRC